MKISASKAGMWVLVAMFAAGPVVTSSQAFAKESTSKTATRTTTKTTSRTSPPASKASGKVKTASRNKSKTTTASKKVVKPDQYAALVVNAETGEVLYEKNAAALRYPASLTKMMTLYLTFDALKRGTLSMDQTLPVSAKAASQPQTNISLRSGDRLPVKTAIESLVVRSANDSSMVLAEALGGTEFNFALAMTQKARELGMKNTVFRNPNGLPDDKQVTTAYDMARLGIALRRDFPDYYHYFKKTSFSWNGVTYPGHNRVMERYNGADGVKTGYIRASGFNLVTSVQRDGYKIVAVVMGGHTASERDNKMIALLDDTFDQLGSNSVARAKTAPGQGASIYSAASGGGVDFAPTGQGDCATLECR